MSRSALARDLLLAALEGSSGEDVTDEKGLPRGIEGASPAQRIEVAKDIHLNGKRQKAKTQVGLQEALGKAVVGSIVDAESSAIAGLPVSDTLTTGKAEPLEPIKQGSECAHPLNRRSWIVLHKSFRCRACKAFVRV